MATQSDLDALNEAIRSGHARVRYSDKEVVYRSLAEMLQARSDLEEALGITPALQSRTARQVRFITDTGW